MNGRLCVTLASSQLFIHWGHWHLTLEGVLLEEKTHGLMAATEGRFLTQLELHAALNSPHLDPMLGRVLPYHIRCSRLRLAGEEGG